MPEDSPDEHDRDRQRSYRDSESGRGQGRTSGRMSAVDEADLFKLMDAYMQMKLGLPLADSDRAEIWRDRLTLLRSIHERKDALDLLNFVAEIKAPGDTRDLLRRLREANKDGIVRKTQVSEGFFKYVGQLIAVGVGAVGMAIWSLIQAGHK